MNTPPNDTVICVLAEYSRNTQSPTGTLYEIKSCFDLSQFNKNFNYNSFYIVISDDPINKFYNADSVVDYVKSISNL